MKWIYILLTLTLVLCCGGTVSAANETGGVIIGDIVDMGEVSDYGAEFWDSANENGAGYLLLGIGLVLWILTIVFVLFCGSARYAVGDTTNNADTTKQGTDQLKRVVVAIVAPPILLILLGIFAGLI